MLDPDAPATKPGGPAGVRGPADRDDNAPTVNAAAAGEKAGSEATPSKGQAPGETGQTKDNKAAPSAGKPPIAPPAPAGMLHLQVPQ